MPEQPSDRAGMSETAVAEMLGEHIALTGHMVARDPDVGLYCVTCAEADDDIA